MQAEEWERIRRNLIFLRDRLNIDVVILYLYQEHVIDDDEEESLSAISDKKDRSIGLLRLLRTKPSGYTALINALIQVQPDIVDCLLSTGTLQGRDGRTHRVNDVPTPSGSTYQVNNVPPLSGGTYRVNDVSPPPPYTSTSYCRPQPSGVQPPSYEQSIFNPGSPSNRRTNSIRTNLPSNPIKPSAPTDSRQSPASSSIPSSESAQRSGSYRLVYDTESQQSPVSWNNHSNTSTQRSGSLGSRHDWNTGSPIVGSISSAPHVQNSGLYAATNTGLQSSVNRNLPSAPPKEDNISSAPLVQNSGLHAATNTGLQSLDNNVSDTLPTTDERAAGHLPQNWTDQETSNEPNSRVDTVDQASRIPLDHGTDSPTTSHNSLISDQPLDDNESQPPMTLDEIAVLVRDLYTDDLTSRSKSCRQLLLNSANTEAKRNIVRAGGIDALLDIVKMEKDESLLEYATGVLWNLSANVEFMGTLMCEGLSVLVKYAIVPFETFSRNRFIFRNAVGILRNISTASLHDNQNGWETRNKLREEEGLVKSVVRFLSIAVDNCDLETKAFENTLYVLRNLSHRIQEIFDKDYDMRQEPQQKEDKGIMKVFARLFMTKSKETEVKEYPFISETVSRHCQGLVDRTLLSMYIKILSQDPLKIVIFCTILRTLSGLMQCNWCYAEELREYFRKEKGLPLLVDLLVIEERRIVDHTAELLHYLTIDSTNGKLIGKYGTRQLIGVLPKSALHKTYSDNTIRHVLSTFDNIFRQNPKENLERLFVQKGGANPLKLIKFVEGVYHQSTKQEAQKVLELLWKVDSLHSMYEEHSLRKPDVISPITF